MPALATATGRLLALGLVAALAAGCGSGADDPDAAASSASSSSPSGGTTGSSGATTGPSERSSTSAEPSAGAGQRQVTITIADFGYSDPGDVRPGQSITVVNDDDVAHTVSARAGDDVFDVNVPAGSTAELKAPGRAGSHAVYCKYRTTMSGTLTVA